IVAKRMESAYTAGRSREWMKIKCHRRQEFVIGGYTDPQGSRGYFGALQIGVYDGPQLDYVSKVGTGFDQEGLQNLWEKLPPPRPAREAPRRRGRAITGSSPGSCARCDSASGPRTAASAIPPSSGSGQTSAPRSAAARNLCHRLPRTRRQGRIFHRPRPERRK